MTDGVVSEGFAEELISALRTAIGDELRSIMYFTRDAFEQIYIRSDLERDADVDVFVANERLGFASQATYGDSELGEYLFTIRVFEHGFLTRAIVDDHGVFVTTDELSMDLFDEVATTLREVLREHGDEVSSPD